MANAALVLCLAFAASMTLLSTRSFPSSYGPLQPASLAGQTAVVTTTPSTTTFSYSSTLQPEVPSQPLLLVYSLTQYSGYAATLSWAAFAAALIWRGHVRSIWGRSRFSYDTFRLLVRMRGAQTRLRLMHSLDEPRNKLQLATVLGLDWKAVDKHVQMLERNGLIRAAATKGTATFYELTDKGARLLQVLAELSADANESNHSP